MELLIVLIVLAGLALFVGLWASILFFISRGGWRRLALEFPEPYVAWDITETLPRSSLLFGRMNAYKNCVRIGVAAEGLVLQTGFLFKLFHPPLFLPWEALEQVGFEDGWLRGMRFVVAEVPILIRWGSGEMIYAEWRRRRGEIQAPPKRLQSE